MRRSLACALLLAGCSYDYDQLYEHAYVPPDGGPSVASEALVKNWFGHMPLDQACAQCAEERCAQENADCLKDPLCVAYTECVGADPTPAGIADCRAKPEFTEWINTQPDVFVRDLGGPYGQCVFRNGCAGVCTDDRETWCSGQYTWRTTSEPTVPLSLYVLEGADSKTPIVNASVRACDAQNARECTDSLGGAPAAATTDANGLVKLDLPAVYNLGFNGYLEITHEGHLPSLVKFSWKLGQPTTALVQIASLAFLLAATTGVGDTVDLTLGMLQLRMFGCQGGGVSGVRFKWSSPEPNPKARPWYLRNLADLSGKETNFLGQGGVIDMTPTTEVEVTAVTADDAVLASSAAPLRAGFMTIVIFVPQSR